MIAAITTTPSRAPATIPTTAPVDTPLPEFEFELARELPEGTPTEVEDWPLTTTTLVRVTCGTVVEEEEVVEVEEEEDDTRVSMAEEEVVVREVVVTAAAVVVVVVDEVVLDVCCRIARSALDVGFSARLGNIQ